jgi:hypothetical protein
LTVVLAGIIMHACYARSPQGIPAMKLFIKIFQAIFSDENLYAVLAFLIFVALVLFTANTAPLWIYQGF